MAAALGVATFAKVSSGVSEGAGDGPTRGVAEGRIVLFYPGARNLTD